MITPSYPMQRSRVKSRGFTLIEMTLTITVMGIIAAIGAQILGSGITSYTATQIAVSALSKAGFAAERLKREIRAVAYTGTAYNVVTPLSSTRLQFVNTSGTSVDVQVALPNLTLAYVSPNVSASLMNALTAASFTYYQKDGTTLASSNGSDLAYVEINFTLNNGSANYARRVRVALREKP